MSKKNCILNRYYLIFFCFFLFLNSCKEDEGLPYQEKEGEVFFEIEINPSLNGLDLLVFTSTSTELIDEVGTDFKTTPFKYFSNRDLDYEIRIISEEICYSVVVESFFENTSFDRKSFQLGGFIDLPLCSDGSLKEITVKTPK